MSESRRSFPRSSPDCSGAKGFTGMEITVLVVWLALFVLTGFFLGRLWGCPKTMAVLALVIGIIPSAYTGLAAHYSGTGFLLGVSPLAFFILIPSLGAKERVLLGAAFCFLPFLRGLYALLRGRISGRGQQGG